jgi:hypothetical protein
MCFWWANPRLLFRNNSCMYFIGVFMYVCTYISCTYIIPFYFIVDQQNSCLCCLCTATMIVNTVTYSYFKFVLQFTVWIHDQVCMSYCIHTLHCSFMDWIYSHNCHSGCVHTYCSIYNIYNMYVYVYCTFIT